MKRFVWLFSLLGVLMALVVLVGCTPIPDVEEEDDAFRSVYNAYVAYAAEAGESTLSYDAWLASIRGADGKDGQDGKDGLTPMIGNDGNWWIGTTNTGVPALGEKGDTGRGIAWMELIDGELWVCYTDSDIPVCLGRVTPIVTTAAPTTATPTTDDPSTLVHPDAAEMELCVENTEYTGSAISRGYTVINSSRKFRPTYSFYLIDPETLEYIDEDNYPVNKPTEAGTYELIATFSWSPVATDADKVYRLPEPMSTTFVVTPQQIDADNAGFGAVGYEGAYCDGLSFEVADTEDATSPIATGTLPTGLVRSYTVEQVDDEYGTNPVAYDGTVISDPGYFKVTIRYAEADGKNNYANEDAITHSAIVSFLDGSTTGEHNQVLRVDGVEIDGVIDPAYYASAWITSSLEDPATVDPYENIAMVEIWQAGKVADRPETSVTIYALWGEETYNRVTTPYIYIAIEVYDPTYFPRSKTYTAQTDAWVNDSIELGYYFGGYEAPEVPAGHKQLYPTYNSVVADAREKTVEDHGVYPNHTAVKMQKSVYFHSIQTATKRYAEKDTYVIEYKIPAKSESYNKETFKMVGAVGGQIDRYEGPALTPGEFIFLTIQHNDLTYLPEGYDDNIPSGAKYIEDPVTGALAYSSEEWKAFELAYADYMCCTGNRHLGYITNKNGKYPNSGPVTFQLSDLYYTEGSYGN